MASVSIKYTQQKWQLFSRPVCLLEKVVRVTMWHVSLSLECKILSIYYLGGFIVGHLEKSGVDFMNLLQKIEQ